MKKIKVIKKRVGEEPKVELIKNDISVLQNIVDGLIDITCIPCYDDIDVICNDEGLLMNKMPNIIRPEYKDFLVGDLIFASYNEEGDTIGLNDEQIQKVMTYLSKNSLPKETSYLNALIMTEAYA